MLPETAWSVTPATSAFVPPRCTTFVKCCAPIVALIDGRVPAATNRNAISGWRNSVSSPPTVTVSMGVTLSTWPWRTVPDDESPVSTLPSGQVQSADQSWSAPGGTSPAAGGAGVWNPARMGTSSPCDAPIVTVRARPEPPIASGVALASSPCLNWNVVGSIAVRPNWISSSPWRPTGLPSSTFLTPPERSPRPGRLRGA